MLKTSNSMKGLELRLELGLGLGLAVLVFNLFLGLSIFNVICQLLRFYHRKFK